MTIDQKDNETIFQEMLNQIKIQTIKMFFKKRS